MGEFLKDRQPHPVTYFEAEGLNLGGRGPWRTTECKFHGGSDSLRVNVETGGFVCMAGCGAKGGDVLAYHRAAHGLGFVEAAKALGAWHDDGKPATGPTHPAKIAARDLLELVAEELMVCTMVLSDTLEGRLTDADFDRYRDAVGRVIFVSEVANGLR